MQTNLLCSSSHRNICINEAHVIQFPVGWKSLEFWQPASVAKRWKFWKDCYRNFVRIHCTKFSFQLWRGQGWEAGSIRHWILTQAATRFIKDIAMSRIRAICVLVVDTVLDSERYLPNPVTIDISRTVTSPSVSLQTIITDENTDQLTIFKINIYLKIECECSDWSRDWDSWFYLIPLRLWQSFFF